MTIKEIERTRRDWVRSHIKYRRIYWPSFDYSVLHNVIYYRRAGRGDNNTYNEVLIMGDTETSKKEEVYRHAITKDNEYDVHENHVVAWTISIRAFDMNIVTLWGRKPSDMMRCITKIMENMGGYYTCIYFHNLAYDYTFLRRFFFDTFGMPEHLLATKPHYPIMVTFADGLILKDSLILAQRSIEKWGADLDVEHQKAVGKWDYNKLRGQNEAFSRDELEYIEHDTLAGVECLEKLKTVLGKKIYSMPYTATGIPREEVQKRGKEARGRDLFNRLVMPFKLYEQSEFTYHGGYVHANRHEIGFIHRAKCFDFASSYPYCILSEKYPMEAFTHIEGHKHPDFVLKNVDEYAAFCRLIMTGIRQKDYYHGMPVLQNSKCVDTVNAIVDNGRILRAEYAVIYVTEVDLQLITEQYDIDKALIDCIYVSKKDYLPRYLTDYVAELYHDKTVLKGGDPVLYALAKAKLNSVYGMMVQKCIKDELIEDYDTGEYSLAGNDPESTYEQYKKKRSNVLLYQWGVWVTAYAMRNLFELGKCVSGIWLYSDTDSCYATEWNQDKVDAYNEKCKQKLIANGYSCVEHNGREYWPGCAELDGEYAEFTALGAKRYCGRSVKDGRLHITVAGVPKKGYTCLKDDITNFRTGLIFPGEVTGKLTHTYIFKEGITIDKDGNETGDSIDLTPCSYFLDQTKIVSWDELMTDEVEIEYYEPEDFIDD